MPDTFNEMWAALLPIGRTESGGYRRLGGGPVERELHAWFAEQCRARGLEVSTDDHGNTVGWWRCALRGSSLELLAPQDPRSEPRNQLLVGSHLDSVPDGGAYDGPLGVVSALAAIDLLRERGVEPARDIGVAAFADEEGAQGVACLGSRAAVEESWLGDVGTYVELHVEQGRALDVPVGVGSGIAPHGRWRFDFEGTPDHAGSTRMEDRHDPVLTFAMTALAANKQARLSGGRATMARLEVVPNATNGIPSRVTAWLDARAESQEALMDLVDEITRQAGARAERDGTRLTVAGESVTSEVRFDDDLVGRVATLLDAPVLPTYAGHDAGILQQAGIPSVMLFVRNPTGVSHSPAEHADEADCLAGVEALATVLEELAR